MTLRSIANGHKAHAEWLLRGLVVFALGGYFVYSLNQNRERIDGRERDRLSHQYSWRWHHMIRVSIEASGGVIGGFGALALVV